MFIEKNDLINYAIKKIQEGQNVMNYDPEGADELLQMAIKALYLTNKNHKTEGMSQIERRVNSIFAKDSKFYYKVRF